MPSSKSITWQSNGSDVSKSDHYDWRTALFLRVTHVLEVFPLIISLWEAIVSDFDRRVSPEKMKIDFWDIFWHGHEQVIKKLTTYNTNTNEFNYHKKQTTNNISKTFKEYNYKTDEFNYHKKV